MCRKLALAATIVLALAGPAVAADKAEKPAVPAQAQPAPLKATAAERAMIERDTPVARAAFWARESRLDPADADAGLKFAAALRAIGKYAEAAEAAEQVSIQHPTNAEAYLAIAKAKLAQKDGFFAINPARRAMALNPKDWRPLNLMGVAFEQTGQDAQAMDAYNRALALSPNNPDVLTNIALVYARKNDAREAERLLRLALAQPRATAQTRQNLAQLVGKQGRIDEARQLMSQDLPPDVVEFNLALLRRGA